MKILRKVSNNIKSPDEAVDVDSNMEKIIRSNSKEYF